MSGKRELGAGRTLVLFAAGLLILMLGWQFVARKNSVPDGLALIPASVQLFGLTSSLEPLLASPLVTASDLLRKLADNNASYSWGYSFSAQCGREELRADRLAAASVDVGSPAAALVVDPATVVFVVPVADHQKFAEFVFRSYQTSSLKLVPRWDGGEEITKVKVIGVTADDITLCSGGNETAFPPDSIVDLEYDDLYLRTDSASGTVQVACAGMLRWGWYTPCVCLVDGVSCDDPLVVSADWPTVETGRVYEVDTGRDIAVHYAAISATHAAVVFRYRGGSTDQFVDLEPVFAGIGAPDNARRFTSDHTFWPSLNSVREPVPVQENGATLLATLATSSGGYPRTSLTKVAFDPSHAVGRVLVPVPEPGSRFYRRLLEDRKANGPQLLQDSSLGWAHLNDLALSSYVDFYRRYFPENWGDFTGNAPAAVTALAAALQPDDGLHNLDIQLVTGSDGVPGLFIAARFETASAGEIAKEYFQRIATELHIVSVSRDLKAALDAAADGTDEACNEEALFAGLSEARRRNYVDVLGAPELYCDIDEHVYFEDGRADGYAAQLDSVDGLAGAVYLSPSLSAEEVELLAAATDDRIDEAGLIDGKYRTVAWLQGEQMMIADRQQILRDAIDDLGGPELTLWTGEKLQASVDFDGAREVAPLYPPGFNAELEPVLDALPQYSGGTVELASRRDLASLLATITVGYSTYVRD
jgi:hypothetical protein